MLLAYIKSMAFANDMQSLKDQLSLIITTTLSTP